MVLNMYSILDFKSSLWSPPFVCRHNVEATRMFERLMSDKDSVPAKYPSDFSLYQIGSFDEETGEVCSVSHSFLNCGDEFNNVG